jgi:anti-sigma B factor antagonist
MRTEKNGAVLLITDFLMLTSDNSRAFKDYAFGALGPEHKIVEVDLAAVRTVDSNGLGALIFLHKALSPSGGRVRLLNPPPAIAEMFQLLQLDKIFEIVQR